MSYVPKRVHLFQSILRAFDSLLVVDFLGIVLPATIGSRRIVVCWRLRLI